MASTHKSLRSGTANKRPTTSIADGQIALNTNTTSPGLFFKDSTGATIIKVGPVHVGTTAPNASPAAGGSAGNSVGEIWLDTSLTPVGVKIWNGSAFVNATPIGSTTVQGLLELATNAETQTGTDPDRAVTPAGLQSKVSDSTSTTSSTTIASSTAVKSAYDLANAALPKSGGTVTGNLEIGTTGSLSFEGATADAFETTIAVVDPTADRTITLPDTTGTVVTTGDTGTVTSTMIADGTIVDADISASAEIAVSKLADGAARQLLQTDAAGTGVEWASNIDVPGTLDVTSTATFDSIASHPLGSAAAPTLTFTGDTNTGIYSPGADQVAISTGGSGRLFVDASGNVNVKKTAAGLSTVGFTAYDTGKVDVTANGATPLFINRLTSNGELISFYKDTVSQGGIKVSGSDFEYAAYNSGALLFTTNSTERLRITSAGLVGVGTSVPGSVLHVNTASGDCKQTISASAGTTSAFTAYVNTTVTAVGTENSTGGNLVSGSSPYATILSNNSAYPIQFGTNNTVRATLDSSGRLGIGTSSPGALLNLQGTFGTSLTTGLRIDGLGTTTNNVSPIAFYNQSSNWGTQHAANIACGTLSGTDGGGYLRFSTSPDGNTAPTEKLRITAAGNVGIGTTPSTLLHMAGGSFRVDGSTSVNKAVFQVTPGASTSAGADITVTYDGAGSYGPLTFTTGGNERARLTSSGQWLVGTSTHSGLNVSGYSGLNTYIANTGDTGISLSKFSNDAAGSSIQFIKSRGASVGTNALVSNGDSYGSLIFGGADGNGYIRGSASIEALVDATPGAGDMPGRLVFSTTADGASSPTERMRIASNGNVYIGGGTSFGSGGWTTQNSGEQVNQYSQTSDVRTLYHWSTNNNGTNTSVAYVQSDGKIYARTTTLQAISSERRLKENIVPLNADDAWETVKSVPFYSYNFIGADPSNVLYGPMADEVPDEMRVATSQSDDVGVIHTYDNGMLQARLYVALQAALNKIEALEAKVAALESA